MLENGDRAKISSFSGSFIEILYENGEIGYGSLLQIFSLFYSNFKKYQLVWIQQFSLLGFDEVFQLLKLKKMKTTVIVLFELVKRKVHLIEDIENEDIYYLVK